MDHAVRAQLRHRTHPLSHLALAGTRSTSAVVFGVGAIGLGGVLIFTDLLPLSGAGTGVGVAIGGLTVLATMVYGIREMRRAEKVEENEDAE